ncbi:hypothetical protein B7468_02790 [Staphylococcus lugdunensis]|nr:hypothetical protein B7468_02790 [Staphylococcus lugdunensis]
MGWGPNKENFDKKFTKQSKLGWGPNKKAFQKKANGQRKLGLLRQYHRHTKPYHTKYYKQKSQ